MEHSFLYKNSSISYRKQGKGKAILLCFHGYGEDANSFDFLEKYIGHQYTIYKVDLPFHGKTDWKEGYDFTDTDLTSIVDGILSLNLNKTPLISLMGFSLGGRIVLGLYQSRPEQIERIVLLAPDGLKVNFWYWLSTQTWLGNRFFSFTMKHPQWFFGFLKLLNKLKLVNASIFKFVNYYIGNPEVRRLLYARWTTLRRIRPHIGSIKSQIKQHSTNTSLVYGRHDRIILSSVGEKFRKGIENQCSIAVIESGHQVLHEKHAKDIMACLTVKS